MSLLRIRKTVNEPIDIDEEGVHVRGGISASISANVNERGCSKTSSRQRVKVVQRGGRTEVYEQHSTTDGDAVEEPGDEERR